MEIEVGFQEDEDGELSDAFGTKRVCVPSRRDAGTLPEESGGGGDNPPERAGVILCAPIRTQEQVVALDEMLCEGVRGVRLEHTCEQFPLPRWEGLEMVEEGGRRWRQRRCC